MPHPGASISIIIPVKNGGADLEVCLAAISRSTRPPAEVIVADDASTDDTAAIAARHGARVCSTGSTHSQGPARARNLGARHATGGILCFLDADVRVHPDTLARIAEDFEADPTLDALMGAYDDTPHDQSFFSQYKNLQHSFVHRFVHSGGKRKAASFWTGCGAVRREVFHEHGGFDATYRRPCIEDIEFGYRMLRDRRRLMLDPDVQVQHRKQWTFTGMVRTDFFDRALPWTELILRDRNLPNDLNLQVGQRISGAMTCLFALLVAAAVAFGGLAPAAGWAALGHAALAGLWIDAARLRSHAITFTGILWGLAAATAAYGSHPGHSTLIAGCAILPFALRVFPWPVVIAIAEGGAATGLLAAHAVNLAPAAALAVVLALNSRFYRFLASRRGWGFALAAVPVHLLYFVYSVAGFAVGTLRYHLRSRPAASPGLAPANEDD